jgi:hypothetical protein
MNLKMDQWSDKKKVLIITLLFSFGVLFSQNRTGSGDEDYKNRNQFEKFQKRRNYIGAWQINRLKAGALVVRLKTDHLLIEELKKQGKNDLADERRIEMSAINLNLIRAFISKYNFSKVYFMYSNSSDSLLDGARQGIFVDTSLNVNPAITMKENFYLLAESDRAYNSSIGFVPEDSARQVIEKGNATTEEFPIILKNKYGHQLKKPFPYNPGRRIAPGKKSVITSVTIKGESIPFNIGGANAVGEKKVTYNYNGRPLTLEIPRMYTYDIISLFVDQLNDDLKRYYQANPAPSEGTNVYEDAKPFLY